MSTPDDKKTTGERLEAVAEEMAERVTGAIERAQKRTRAREPTPVPIPTSPIAGISSEAMKLAVKEQCEACQKPGGPMHTVVEQVTALAADVRAVLLELAGRKGEKRVWAVLRFVTVPLCCAILGFALNHLSAKRTEEMLRRQVDIAADVALKLKAVQDGKPHTMLAPVSDTLAADDGAPTKDLERKGP
jgi:hypothetical protein